MIYSISSLNPMSRILSTSSITKIHKLEVSKYGVSFMCCRSLPGVATRMFISAILSFSYSTSFPPMTSPALIWCKWANDRRTSKHWIANSRTGTIIRAPSPSSFDHLSLFNFSIRGMRYERVFPEPVLEQRSKSLLFREWGIAHLYTSVILMYFAFQSPWRVFFEIGRSWNLTLILERSVVHMYFLPSLISSLS